MEVVTLGIWAFLEAKQGKNEDSFPQTLEGSLADRA